MQQLSRIYTVFFLVLLSSTSLIAQTSLPLDFKQIKQAVEESPKHGTKEASYHFKMISLPMPDGTVVDFMVKHAPLSQSKSPLYGGLPGDVYNLHAPEVAGYNGSMIVYPDGIHATLNTPEGLLFIERTPSVSTDNMHAFTYYKDVEPFIHNANDAIRPGPERIKEINSHSHQDGTIHAHDRSLKANNNFFEVGGNNQRKELDLFILSEKSFVDQFNGNVTNATNRVVEIVNGVKVIWEQDFNITLNYMGVFFHPNVLDENAAQAIWNATSDADVNGGTKADVDLAHYFVGAGGGGAASLFIACDANKYDGYSASGNVTGPSYISLVAHEMAHQMGVDHTWTGNSGACTAGQFGWSTGVEPGSGVTLAGYAGICGNDDIPNIGNGSFHHLESVREVVIYAQSGLGKSPFSSIITQAGEIPAYANNYGNPTCLNDIAYTNNVPQVNANPDGLTNLNLPARTPFELKGSATDADGDPLTYQWDQMDFALDQAPLDAYATRADGPLFRSYFPTNDSVRIFPKLNDILQATQVSGEILPQVSRVMRFGLMVRDGKGGVGMDTIGFNVVDGGQSFSVVENIDMTNPAAVSLTWNKANTDQAPISCNNVTILYSTDGGQTFPHVVMASTSNDGSESVDLSQYGITSSGRIKIKCATSIFFDINNQDLTIGQGANCLAQMSQICNRQIINAPIADVSLDLDESDYLIDIELASSFMLTASNSTGSSIIDNNGSCEGGDFEEYPVTMEFTVSQSGIYNFSDNALSTIAVLEKGNYVYNSNNPCNDSGVFLGANYDPNFSQLTLNPTLEKCKTYTILLTALSASADVTLTISGPAPVIRKGSQAAGTSYSFIAIDDTDDQIDAVSATADFTALGAGNYKVYGVSYASSITTADWIGMTQAQALNASVCVIKSSNFHTLNISGQPCIPSTTTTDVMPFDIVANAIFEDGKIISGGIGEGRVTIDADNIIFRAEQDVEFIPEFEVISPNRFTAEIVPCEGN